MREIIIINNNVGKKRKPEKEFFTGIQAVVK